MGRSERSGYIAWSTRHLEGSLLAALRRFAKERHWTVEHAHNVALAAGLRAVELALQRPAAAWA